MHAKHSIHMHTEIILLSNIGVYTPYGNRVLCVGFLSVEYIWCISYGNELILINELFAVCSVF